jgi:hypothetical protein
MKRFSLVLALALAYVAITVCVSRHHVYAASEKPSWKAQLSLVPMVSGTYNADQLVTIINNTPGSNLYYTTDGTTPSPTHGTRYTEPVWLHFNCTLNAVAGGTGYVTSPVTSATFTFAAAAPTFSLPAGTYSGPQTLTLASPTTIDPDAKIVVVTSLPGMQPSRSYYTGPITIATSEVIYATTQETGFAASPQVENKYVIQ